MADGQNVGIHDVQMRYDKGTDEILILLPGNSSDPTKIIRLPNGGGGSGQGFPVNPARAIVFNEDESEGPSISTDETSPTGMRATNQDIQIQANAPLDQQGTVELEGNGLPLDAQSGVVRIKGNGIPIAEFEVDPDGVQRFGIFQKVSAGHAGAIPPISNAVDLPSALVSLNALLTGLRALGWIEEF